MPSKVKVEKFKKGGKAQRRNSAASDASSEDAKHGSTDNSAAFEVAFTEGVTLKNSGQYKKAITSFTRALEIKPTHKKCLLTRSACYQQIGESNRALADTNKTLEEENSKFIKGILQKADVYYQMSEFEFALMFYHRGNKIRPEIQSFRLGIQKCQEAIENAIGGKAGIKLTKQGDLSFFIEEQKPDANKRREMELAKASNQKGKHKKGTPRGGKQASKSMDSKTVQQLLGELYADKEYLEKLLAETENTSKSKTKDQVIELATECLDYLDTRTEFWHQQQPTYSRQRDKKMQQDAMRRGGDDKEPGNPAKWIIKNLAIIDNDISNKNYHAALDRANSTIEKSEKFSEESVPDLQKLLATLHSYAGNALLELKRYKAALKHHNTDHEISTKLNFEEGLSRAKDNLGRVHVRMGEYKKAIDIFEQKVPLSTTDLENAWLFHEIGRCHLELGNAEKAKECGQTSLESAYKASDDGELWQLNAEILIAQSETRLEEYEAALQSFKNAESMAVRLSDKDAELAIKKAIKDVKKLIKGEELVVENEEEENMGAHRETSEKVGDDDKKSIRSSKGSVKETDVKEATGENSEALKKDETIKPKGKKESESYSQEEKNSGFKKSKTPNQELLGYKVSLRIGDSHLSETEESIFIEIVGEKGATRREILEVSETPTRKFEKGKTYDFNFNLMDVGKITKLIVGQTDTYPGMGCFIEEIAVDIVNGQDKRSCRFPCKIWLDKAESDGQTQRELTDIEYLV